MKNLIFFLFLFGTIVLHGQRPLPTQQPPCGFDNLINNDPEVQSNINFFNDNILNYQNNQAYKSLLNSPSITIPVVVYVVHPQGLAIGTGANISDAQIISQIDAMNNYFSAYNISFCLATKKANDPIPIASGAVQNTPGIVHQASNTLTNHTAPSDQQNLISSTAGNTLGYYSGEKYLRIWVVSSISGLGSGVLGYSMFPNSSSYFDGIVMRYDVFGDNSNCSGCYSLVSNYDKGDTLIHEFGHYMGLYHTFEGGCNAFNEPCDIQGDRVCDTPPTSGPNYYCLAGVDSCLQDFDQDDITNYMDYGNDNCTDHFSQGQFDRIQAAFALYRSELFSTTNLIYTGVCGYENLVSAEFDVSTFSPCVGTSILFTPIMQNANSYLWDFGDGATSNQASPTHSYTSQSVSNSYSVTLTVNGVSSITKQIFVTDCNSITSSDGNWYLGSANMLNFSLGVPFVSTMPSSNSTQEAASIQSDNNGNLLFYTNGVNIWDSSHNLVNVSNPLLGNVSSAKGVAIVPNPSNSNQYYIFTKPSFNATQNGFRYSIVDVIGSNVSMSGIINQPISAAGFDLGNNGALISNESVVVSQNCNGYWVFTTAFKNNQQYLLIFNVESSGLTLTDEFLIGNITNNNITDFVTTLEVSPNGNYLSLSSYSGTNLLFSIDKFNGLVNGVLGNLSNIPSAYDSQFSPNSNFIYFYTTVPPKLYCYNIETNTSTFVANLGGNNKGGIQLAPDNKIYLSVSLTNRLSAINTPDDWSDNNVNSCNFTEFAGPELETSLTRSAPNLIDATMNTSFDNTISSYAQSCYEYQFSPNICGNVFDWNFGDLASGSSNTSFLTNPTHTFSSSGTYTVSVTVDGSQTVTKDVVIDLPSVSIMGDKGVCLDYCSSNTYSTNLASGEIAEWTVIGGTINGLSNQSYVNIDWNSLPGSVSLTITNTAGCSSTDGIVVKNSTNCDCGCECVSEVSFTSDPVSPGSLTYNFNGSATFTNCPLISGSAYRYVWNFGDGTTATGNPIQQHTYLAPGPHQVSLFLLWVSPSDNPLCQTESVINYTARMVNDHDDNSDIENSLMLFPNPAKYKFNLSFISGSEEKITVNLKNRFGINLSRKSFKSKDGENYIRMEIPNNITHELLYVEILWKDKKVIKKLLVD